jgi:hypothetical protein
MKLSTMTGLAAAGTYVFSESLAEPDRFHHEYEFAIRSRCERGCAAGVAGMDAGKAGYADDNRERPT